MTRSNAPRPRVGDPYGVGPVGSWIAPILSIVGLLIIALITLSLLDGKAPFVGGANGGGAGVGSGSNGGGATRTATPPDVVLVPDITFPGSIVYAKAGNIWVQAGKDPRQLTSGSHDSMPSWSPDGTYVYFVRTIDEVGIWPSQGRDSRYDMTIPSVVRVKADGSGKVEPVLSGRISKGAKTWFSWIRQPVVAPNGTTLALVSDGPDPAKSDVVLQFYDLATKKRSVPDLSENPPLGHQDPVWRPDGQFLLYVRNGREGARGAPIIFRWDVRSGRSAPLTGPGYLEPAFSPDGRYLAATRASSFGNDIVILDASRGRELLRVTNDGSSWAPVWSPTGDSIAFLHIEGQIVDLQRVMLDGTAPNWTVGKTVALTELSGLDGGSRPGWFVPANELPAQIPTSSGGGAPSDGGSVAP